MTTLEDAAVAYVAARQRHRSYGDMRNDVELVIAVDDAWHTLVVACGAPCECEPGTCPNATEVEVTL